MRSFDVSTQTQRSESSSQAEDYQALFLTHNMKIVQKTQMSAHLCKGFMKSLILMQLHLLVEQMPLSKETYKEEYNK